MLQKDYVNVRLFSRAGERDYINNYTFGEQF